MAFFNFHVRTVEGVFHSGYTTEETAQAAADAANRQATALGITTRYEVGLSYRTSA